MFKSGVLRLKLIVFESQGDFFFFDFAHFQKSKPNFLLSPTLCFHFMVVLFKIFTNFSEIEIVHFQRSWSRFSKIGSTFYFWRDFWFCDFLNIEYFYFSTNIKTLSKRSGF